MVIPFLEFGIFWESLFTFLLIQIALWHKLDSSCKKDFTKIMQNDWKVNKLCWLFTQNQCRNNISIREIDTLLFFPLDFILESRISPRRRSCRAANDTSLKHQDHKGYFGALEFLKSCKTLRCEATGLSFSNGGSTIPCLIIVHPKIWFIFLICRVYDLFWVYDFAFFSEFFRVYDYLGGVRFFTFII